MCRQYLKEVFALALNDDNGDLMEYCHLIKDPKYRALWIKSYRNELGRISQGMPGRVKCTNTIFFIDKADIPADRWKYITYGRIVVSYRPEKSDSSCMYLTVGGNRVNYHGYCGTPTTDLLNVKLFLNSTISTPVGRFMILNKKYFYLITPMEQYEYMRLKLADLPEDVIK